MQRSLAFLALLCLSTVVRAVPVVNDVVAKRTQIGNGCSWCSVGPWQKDVICQTGEFSAVASSMINPPISVKFDATSFCSEFLRPLITQVSVINVTAAITTSTSTVISLVEFTPSSTSTATKTSATSSNTTTHTPTITPSPTLAAARGLAPRDFTVPEYLEAWYYYGDLNPGCSCIITSAAPSILFSATSTSTIYNYTISTTVTEVYTVYPWKS